MNSKEIKILRETSMGEMLKAYSAILKIKVAFIKYNFIPENIEDHMPPMTENSYEILSKMAIAMNDLLCDIYDICEESDKK